ncbi:Alpha-xylosidase 1 [Balamuthia mandrillaris]
MAVGRTAFLLLVVTTVVLLSATAVDGQDAFAKTDCSFYCTRQDEFGPCNVQDYCNWVGCTWQPSSDGPWCSVPTVPDYYVTTQVQKTKTGVTLHLTPKKSRPFFGPDVRNVSVAIYMETANRLHVKISDANATRFEIPPSISPRPPLPKHMPSTTHYSLQHSSVGEPFWFQVIRTSTGEKLFDTRSTPSLSSSLLATNNINANEPTFNNLIFKDQYLEISTKLPKGYHIYGLGESFRQNFAIYPGETRTLWTMDNFGQPTGQNAYGSHPFYLEVREGSKKAHGVYLRNSNAMEVVLGEQYLTYKVTGGVLDFYFFLGETVDAVMDQYTDVIGKPALVPFWGLGFHQCRWGYNNVDVLQQVLDKYRQADIPLDTIWTDIDYMEDHRDFTVAPSFAPNANMAAFLDKLHKNGQHYVLVVDPSIQANNQYSPYTDGLKEKVFVRDNVWQNPFYGKSWAGDVVFPDFFCLNSTTQWWTDNLLKFRKDYGVSFDGLWLDMNEPSNMQYDQWIPKKPFGEFDSGHPPFVINNRGGHLPISYFTINTDALHCGLNAEDGSPREQPELAYNVHNMYGLSEAKASYKALVDILGKRPFLIARSSFPGSGTYTGHWTGDNLSLWEHLHHSISSMLNSQLFGMPFVGSDICGFGGDSVGEELCARWMALGAFYPFARNHFGNWKSPQEPFVWPTVAKISSKLLHARYSLLNYYYTLLFEASVKGSPVVRALFFDFANDSNTFAIDDQFMVGHALLVCPVVKQGALERDCYFPPDALWYDFFSNAPLSNKKGGYVHLDAPLDVIPVFQRGGTIMPMQHPALTTTELRQNPFYLRVALDANQSATGSLYYDDGDSIDPITTSSYLLVSFSAAPVKSASTRTIQLVAQRKAGTAPSWEPPSLASVEVLGVPSAPTKVTFDGTVLPSSHIKYNNATSNLSVQMPDSTSILDKFTLAWSY